VIWLMLLETGSELIFSNVLFVTICVEIFTNLELLELIGKKGTHCRLVE
jgi:hypothetical protein